jgi:hypothetical protein
MGDANKPGVRAMIESITSNGETTISPEGLVDRCLDQMGAISVSDETRTVLTEFASRGGDLQLGATGPDETTRQRVTDVLQLVASTQEFQRS